MVFGLLSRDVKEVLENIVEVHNFNSLALYLLYKHMSAKKPNIIRCKTLETIRDKVYLIDSSNASPSHKITF